MKSVKLFVVAGLAALGVAAGASAAPQGMGPTTATYLNDGVYRASDPVVLDKAQFIIGAQNYCWYPDGWRGPGFYWCGYAFRRGLGWGGPYGWNGWGGGYPAGWRGGNWHGRWYGVRGPGWRGGRADLRGDIRADRRDLRDRRDRLDRRARRDRREDRPR